MYLDLLDTGDGSATTSHSRLRTQFPSPAQNLRPDGVELLRR
jgi:hypothetical protein